jgi:hypothetical protein
MNYWLNLFTGSSRSRAEGDKCAVVGQGLGSGPIEHPLENGTAGRCLGR